jgi:hypothetical protein
MATAISGFNSFTIIVLKGTMENMLKALFSARSGNEPYNHPPLPEGGVRRDLLKILAQ